MQTSLCPVDILIITGFILSARVYQGIKTEGEPRDKTQIFIYDEKINLLSKLEIYSLDIKKLYKYF